MGKLNSIDNKLNSTYKEELKSLSKGNDVLNEVIVADFQLNKNKNIKRNDKGYLIIDSHEQDKIKAGMISNKYDFKGLGIHFLFEEENNE